MRKSVLDILNKISQTTEEEANKIQDNVLLIDGLNTFIRAFAVSPTTNEDGEHIGGITGFLLSIGYAIKLLNPSRVVIVFDGKGGSRRRSKLYPAYKEARKNNTNFNRNLKYTRDEEKQLRLIQMFKLGEYLNTLPVTTLSVDYVEADDVIAEIATEIIDHKVTIMSTDKDFIQLIDDRVNVWSPTKKKLYTPDNVEEDFGFPAHNFLMYRLMDGDNSDNIPGVKGAGKKVIQKHIPILLGEDTITLHDLKTFVRENESKYKIFEKIRDNFDTLELNEHLMRLDGRNVSAKIKMLIKGQVEADISRFNKTRFMELYIRDKIYSGIKNVDSWLNEVFGSLDFNARELNGR